MIHALNFKFKNIPIVFFAKLFYLAEIVGHSPKRLSCKIVLLTTKEKETVHKNFTSWTYNTRLYIQLLEV